MFRARARIPPSFQWFAFKMGKGAAGAGMVRGHGADSAAGHMCRETQSSHHCLECLVV